MALLHQAKIHPTKLELLAAWLPGRSWYQGPAGGPVERVASCRFDDPAGEVGIETILVQAAGGPVHHVPLTYRGAPLDGGEAWLVGTCEHTVLGPRWVYDACGDPVYLTALATAIFAGTGEAEEFIEIDGRRQYRKPAMTVSGTGYDRARVPVVHTIRRVVDEDPTLIVTDSLELTVVRTVAENSHPAAGLLGTWAEQTEPVLLASLRES